MRITKEEIEFARKVRESLEKEMSSVWEKSLTSSLSENQIGTTTSAPYSGGLITWKDLANLPIYKESNLEHTKLKITKVGSIPKSTYLFSKVRTHYLVHYTNMKYGSTHIQPLFATPDISSIIIIEETLYPTLRDDLWGGTVTLFVCKEWLKQFMTKEDLAELAAVRMRRNAK